MVCVLLSPPAQQLSVARSSPAMGARSVFHHVITTPPRVSPIQPQGQGSGKAVTKLFSTRLRPFATPARSTDSPELGDDGCPEWGAEFCRRSARGSVLYLERVATVREIEVLSAELLDMDPCIYSVSMERALVSQWAKGRSTAQAH